MAASTDEILDTFSANCRSIQKLTNLDRTIQTLLQGQLEFMHSRLVKPPYSITDNDKLNGGRSLELVKTLRRNDSLRWHFQEVTNQAVVLLVSYFASSIHDFFRLCVESYIDAHHESKLLTEDFKTNLSEMKALADDFAGEAADFVITKKQDISFQDMKSIARTFCQYFEIEIPRDEVIVDNIIAAQACRHAIVHNGARASAKTVNQLRAAPNRQIKDGVSRDDRVDISSDELEVIDSSMKSYIGVLAGLVSKRIDSLG